MYLFKLVGYCHETILQSYTKPNINILFFFLFLTVKFIKNSDLTDKEQPYSSL